MSKYGKREDELQTYDPNVDYMKKMQQAAEQGDMEAAARYEQQRNEKIKGEGLTQYAQTHDYAKYLPKTTTQQMDDIMKQIQERKPFEFDLNGDALFQQYKDLFAKQGKLAMEDAMGQAAELTGGYGNSYAQTIGQQAYYDQPDRLTDLAPELYAQRRAEYDADADQLYRLYSLLAQKEGTEYSREQDEYNRRWAEDERDYGREQDAYNRQWNEEERDYNRQQYEQSQQKAEQDAEREKAYELTLMMLQNGLMPSDAVLGASGLSAEDAQKLYAYATQPVYSSGGSSGGGGSSSGGGSGSGSKTAGGKTLTKSDMEELRDLYNEGSKNGDLKAFYNQKSLLAALGYDVSAFDSWAGQEYTDYASDKPQGVTYNKYGVEDITDLMRKISTSSNAEVERMMEELDGQFTKEQWAMIEPLLIKRGIFG
ncbi:MAG: hypothetical protein J6K89_07165 [Oscillospiraceae bacterium]|nr:hypothetical protein [Oscillospiraceae bacterium]